MKDGQLPQLIFLIIMAVFVASALFSRRMSFGKLSTMIATWLFIFGAIIVIFSFRDQFKTVWKQVKTELGVAGNSIDADGKLRIPMSTDGHFWADVMINGKEHRMMVDTGATQTAIGGETARRLGIEVDRSRFPVMVETANGTVNAFRAKVQRLKVGTIVRGDFPVLISDSFGDTSLLGMDFLSSLKAWKMEGKQLVLN